MDEIGGRSKEHQSIALSFQAVRLQMSGDWTKALELRKEEELILRELGNKENLEVCLFNQAMILRQLGNPKRALALLNEQQMLCRELRNESSLEISLQSQAELLVTARDFDGALAALKEQEQLSRKLRKPSNLQICLDRQEQILKIQQDLAKTKACIGPIPMVDFPQRQPYAPSWGWWVLLPLALGTVFGILAIICGVLSISDPKVIMVIGFTVLSVILVLRERKRKAF